MNLAFSHTQKIFPYSLIILVVLVCDFRIFNFSFQQGWDDQWVAINNYTDEGFTFQNLQAIVSEFYHGQYAPVNQLYYTTLKHWFGYDPFAFHLFGVIIHLVNSLLCYVFVLRLLKQAFLFETTKAKTFSLWTAVLFASCPINLEPIAWIAASKILLYASFYLLALICYLKYISNNNPKYYYATILFFLLSFGAKEQAVTLPIALLLLDYVHGRPFKDSLIWLEKAPPFLIALGMGVITLSSQQLPADFHFHYTYDFKEKLFLFPYTISEYLTKCILPYNLSFLYPFPFEPGETIPKWLGIYPLLGLAAMTSLIRYRKNRMFVFAISFFLIHILIASNAINLARFAIVADRYAYVSTIGSCFLIVYCLSNIKTDIIKGLYISSICLSLVLTGFCAYTIIHSPVWQSTYTLKKNFRNIILKRKDYKSLLKRVDEEENN